MPALPQGWVQKVSKKTGNAYYYNSTTGQSQWEFPSEEDAQPQGKRVQVSHLLVKHEESRNPHSWRQKDITRTKKQAISILMQHHATLADTQLSTSERAQLFAQLASKHSDCSSAKRGGDLGPFGRGAMQKEFEKASFALQVGQLTSTYVDTASGVHIILRTA